MVAIVSGSSLGLNLSSLATLGQRGLLGNASHGRSGEQAFVNIATGNLIISDRDDSLVGIGGAVNVLRTYNSQGAFTDDNGDNWLNGLDTKILVSGTPLTAGSTITRTDRDGSAAVYQYDSAKGVYVSSAGGGANDTISYDSAQNRYTWTDGSALRTDVYSGADGHIQVSKDAQGNTLTYTWGQYGVTSIANSNGESLVLDYDSGSNLSRVRTMVLVNGSLTSIKTVSYEYDTSNRLAGVTVDLTPGDGSITDGNVYKTTYTYDGTSKRVQSVNQSDGTRLVFEYVQVGSDFRVSKVTDALGQATTYTYDLANRRTTVIDSLGLRTRYDYDANGQLIRVESPGTGGSTAVTTFTYNANGDVTRVVDPESRAIDMEYDANGNQVLQRDAAGNTVKRVYDALNRLLTETTYLVPDSDGSGSAQPSQPLTTRYIYDAGNKNLLRFTVSPQGRVTEYRYDALGNRTRSIEYSAGTYNVSTLTETSVLTESQLATWAAAQDQRRVLLVEQAYDARGQLQKSTTYTDVDASGNGVAAGASVTQFVYDQDGRLLKTISGTGGITQYSYDGLGRVIASADALNQMTLTQYDDASGKTTVQSANGLVTTSTFDKAGRLVSIGQFGIGAQALGQTTYAYDADGRLLMKQDPTGVRAWALYDDEGRKSADIDGNGTLTEYIYNKAGQLTEAIKYATAVSTAQLVNAQGVPTNPALASLRPAATALDSKTWRVYDSVGRLIKSVDAAGAVTETRYDGASRVIAVVRYATTVDTSTLGANPTAASVAPPTTAADRILRNFYDADGLLRATLDGEGYLSELRYDAAGNLTDRFTYATATSAALRATGALDQLIPATNAADAHTVYLYNAGGQLAGEVDAENYLTERIYDTAGNLVRTIRYSTKVTGTVTASSLLATIRPASKAADQISVTTYDLLNRVSGETNAEGTVMSYTYDVMGNRTSSALAVGTTDLRTLNARFDIQGRLIAELSGEGAAKLTAGMTQTQIDAIWTQYATTYTYDAASRRTSSTDANGYKTLYFYDADSRLTHTVNALGEVEEHQYTALGKLSSSIRYNNRISLAGLTGPLAGGLVNTVLTSAVNAVLDFGKDIRTTITYSATGAVASSRDAVGYLTRYAYNAFGEETSRVGPLRSGSTTTETSSYDRRGLKVEDAFDPTGMALVDSFVYDAFGRVIRSIDANGNVREASFDRLGRIIQTKDAIGAVRNSTFDAFNRVLTQTDGLGNTTTYTYSDSTRKVTITLPGNVVTSTVHNRHGQTVKITDAIGNDSLYKYDRNGNLIQTDTNLTQTKNTYDRADRLISAMDANGNTITYSYDAAGRVLKQIVDPTGLNLTTTYTYDGRGNRISVQDARGTLTTFSYDMKGNMFRETVDPTGLNLQTVYGFDAHDNVVNVSSPSGASTAYTYDAAGRRIKELIQMEGIARLFAYDKKGNVTSSTDANGNVTRFAYDANDRLIFKLDPVGNLIQSDYDVEGRIVRTVAYATPISLTGLSAAPTVADILGRIVAAPARDVMEARVYDANDHLRFTVDGTGSVVELRYNANGKVIERVAYANRIALGNWDGSANPVVVADAARDQRLRTVYDDINRPIYSIDGAGVVTETDYDENGNVLEKITYATPVPVGTAATASAVKAAVALIANAAKDAHIRTAYDAKDRPIWSVDGVGAVTQRVYDATGNVVRMIRYASPLAAGAAFSSVKPSASDVVTAFVYDSVNRQVFQIDSLGGVTEQAFDGVGNITLRTHYSTSLNGATLTQLLANPTLAAARAAIQVNVGLDRVERYAYDSANRLVIAVDPQGAATETSYDGVGNVVAVRSYARAVDTTGLPANTYVTVLRTRLVADAANDRVVRQAYDAAGRMVFKVDALGYVKQTSYSGTGAVTSTTQYALAIPPSTMQSVAGIAAAVVAVSSLDQSNTFRYDAAGHLIGSTDAMGYTESYTYNGLGEKVSYTNKKGNVWTFDYDAAGRLTQEVAPSEALVSASQGAGGSLQVSSDIRAAVVTRYQYDALGNLVARTEAAGLAEERTTRYEYDALGRQIKTIFPPVAVYSEALGSVATNGQSGDATRVEITKVLESQTFYDTLGNAVAGKDVAGGISTKVYDALGKVLYEVDAEGYVTGYTRNAFGDVTRLVRYATRTVLSDGSLTSASQATTRAAVEAAINAAGIDHGLDRTMLSTYDRLGRSIEVVEPQSFVYDSSAAANAQYFTAGKTTRKTYDSFGNVVQLSELRNAVTNSWITTTSYFDKRNELTATVDALGYLTTKSYDAVGNVTSQTEYANAIAAGSWSVSSYGMPVGSGDDRTTLHGFDLLNRKTSETRVNVEFSDSANGSSTRGNLSTTYGYDALGNQTRVTAANGQSTYTYYDALGRIYATARPSAFWDANGSSLSAVTLYKRDAYGNVALQIDMANVASAASESVLTVGAGSGADRYTYIKFDLQGHAIQTTDAAGINHYTSYNDRGQVAKTWQSVTGNDQITHTQFEVYQYDRLGRLTHTLDPASTAVLRGGVSVSSSSAPGSTDATGRVTLTGNNTVNLGWSSLIDPNGGLVRVEVDYFTSDTRYQGTADAYGHTDTNGKASQPASRTVDYAAGSVANGVQMLWADAATDNGGIGGITYVRVLQFVNGKWVSKWEGSPAQGNGAGFGVVTQAEAGIVDHGQQYNAFGEVVRKGVNGGWQEYFDYDNSGQVWRSNSGDGVDRITLYDLNGNATADVRSAGSGRDDIDITTVGSADAARWLTDARRTDVQYDALGRKVSEAGAERLESQGGVLARRTAVTSGISSSATANADERGYVVWNGTNEVRLSWSSLAGLGNGAVKVEFDYVTSPFLWGGHLGRADESGNTNESGQLVDRILAPGVAATRSQILTAEQGADGAVFAWQNNAGNVSGGVSGGVSKITGVRVYKQDVNGQWVLVNNQSAMGNGGNAIEVASPANPGTNVALLLRPAGSNADWNSINSSSLVRFGDVLRYDATGLPAGNYEYQVRTTGSDGATHVTGTGTLNLASPPLATIGTPITYGAAGAGVLSWQSPGDDVTQVLRYRQPGGQWATMTATSLGNGLYGVNTSSFGPAVYQFELLWTHAGDAGPFAHATGQLQKVAERAGYWVPQVNYPPVGVSLRDGIAGTKLGADETGAPIYAKDENGVIIGAHSTKVLHWNAPNGNVQFLYRTAGGAWTSLQVVNFGRNEAGVTAYQEVDIGGLAPGSYEYQLVATDANGARVAQALGNLTVNSRSAGHYEMRDVQVQVPVTVSPPDPARYIIGSTNARYTYPVVVGSDEAGNQYLGAHYAWQGNVVVGVPYYETQVVGYQQQWYTVQVPTRGAPMTRGKDENGNTLYVHDEAGNIMYETIWVTEWRSQWVPVYGNVTIYPPDPNQYMTQAPKTVYSAPVMLGRNESGGYILGSHYAWQGNVVVGVPYTEYQWQTRQQQVWVEGTTPPPSMESTTPPYTPAYYVGGAPAQYGVAVSTPPNSGSTSLDPSQAGGVLGHIAQINGDANWVRSTVVQKLDRWGNVIEITDPRSPNWKTTYRYNANNQVIEERKPDANGYQSGDSPVTRVTYDRLGRQVSVTDANGNVNGTGYNAAGNVIADYHPDGSVSYGYNTFGDKISTVDAMGHLTRYSYDNLGHLLVATHSQVEVTTVDGSNNLQSLGSQNLAQRYRYDQAGRLLSQTNGAGETTWYSYDLHGNVISTKLNMGQTTSAAYDVLGKKIAEIDPNGASATWRYTYFGKLLGHTDIGGAVFTYRYDNAKQLIAQTSSRGQSIGYSYDAAGQMTTIRDYAIDQVTTYAYDLAGNHVREKTVQQGITYQDNFLAYDALNRLRDVADGSVHITIDYDKVGNRTHIGTHTFVGDTSHDSNRFFQYDSMNRQIVVDAIDAAGNLGQQGHRLTYDANGNRTSDTYYGNQVVVAGGQRVLLGLEEDGTAIYDTTPVTYTRQQGMVTETYRYDAQDRIVSVVRDGVQIDHRNYDGAGRVTMTGPNGALPQGYAQKLNEGVEQGQTNGLETRINRYDQNGRLVHQRTLKSDNAAKSDIDYTAYDAAGNVLQYRMTDHEGGYTNTYNYTFARYDGYKEDTISGTSTKLNPGSTKSDYDVNGNLIRVTDSTKAENNRTFVNDSAGHVLLANQGGNVERELVVNGEVLGRHGVGVDQVTPRNSQGNPNFAQIADFEFGYSSIVSNYPNAAPGSYTVQSGDTLQSIARSAYGDSALWYQIADANGLASDSGLRVGQTLNIPNKAAGVHNDGGVFKPYDPSKIVGDKTPNLATPSNGAGSGGGGCGVVGMVIMVIVAVVATVFTAGAAGVAMAGVASGIGAGSALATAGVAGIMTAGGAILTGGAIAGLTTGMAIGAAVVGGAVGSIVSQGVGIATGMQDKFSWSQVALSGIGAGATAGIGAGLNAAAQTADGINKAILTSAALRVGMANAVTQGIGVATGLQPSFNWKGVAAAAVGAQVGASLGGGLDNKLGDGIAGGIAKGVVTGLAGGVTAAALRGGRVDVTMVAADAFGNALAGGLVAATQRSSQAEKLAESERQSAGGTNSPGQNDWRSAGRQQIEAVFSDALTNPTPSRPGMLVADLGNSVGLSDSVMNQARPEPTLPTVIVTGSRDPSIADLVYSFAGTAQGLAMTVADGMRFVNDQGWALANGVTGGWLADHNSAAQDAVVRNAQLGRALVNAPGAIARTGLQAITLNLSLADVKQGAEAVFQTERIAQLRANGDAIGAQALLTQNAIGVVSLLAGGAGVARSATALAGAAGRTVATGTQLAAEAFGESRTGQLVAAKAEQLNYKLGMGSYIREPGIAAIGRTDLSGAEYLGSPGRIARYEAHLQRLVAGGYSGTEALAEFSGRIEMLKRGYVLEGDGKLIGNVTSPGVGRGSNGIDRVYRSLENPDNLIPVESKYRAQFNGNSPLDLLAETNYGKQMSTQWMDRKIDQMMFGPHGSRINQLGEDLFLKGYQGRYMNVLNRNGDSYFYDLNALGIK